jgi:PASTA domain
LEKAEKRLADDSRELDQLNNQLAALHAALPRGIIQDDSQPFPVIGWLEVGYLGAEATAVVPNVGGATQSAATAALQSLGLVVGTVTTVRNPAPAGTVLGQTPAAEAVVLKGTVVLLSVSDGMVVVPNVLSQDESSAKAAIINAGLAIGRISHENNCIDPGSVQVQDPNAGAIVHRNTSVNLSISTCTGRGGGRGGGGGGGPIKPK